MRTGFQIDLEPDNREIRLFAFLILASSWIASRGYLGIWHDARLYTLQALQHLYPDRYANELFLLGPDQDHYTLFSRLHAELIQLCGLNGSSLIITTAGLVLWFAAARHLARVLAPDFTTRIFFLLLLFSFSAYYGEGTFRYGESFATPRVFVEAIVLFASAFLVRGKWKLATGCVLPGLLIHPLIALTGLLLIFAWLVQETLRWLWLLPVGVISCLTLAWVGIEPFAHAFVLMDLEWFEIVRARNDLAFITQWGPGSLLLVLVDFTTLFLVYLQSRTRLRRIFFAALLTGVAGCLANLLLADFLGNWLMVQLQLFRVLWLVRIFVWLAFATLLMRVLSPLPERTALLSIAALLSSARMLTHMPLTCALLLGGAALCTFQLRSPTPHPSHLVWKRVLWLTIPVWIVTTLLYAIYAWQEIRAWVSVRQSYNAIDLLRDHWIMQLYPMIALALILALLLLFFRFRAARFRKGLIGVALLLLLLSLLMWDRRGGLDRRLEEAGFEFAPQLELPEESVVFWGDYYVSAIWFGFDRASYVSRLQGAGILFNRDTAFEWMRRGTHLQRSVINDTLPESLSATSILQDADIPTLERVCSDPILDFVVVTENLPGGVPFQYRLSRYYLFSCEMVR